VNRRIRVPRVLLIDEQGNRLGEFMTDDALRLAQERGLDLVEVAPNARPPVCKIADYGRLKYEKKKKEAAARRNQVQVQLKEVKLRPKTDDHDMETKVRHARRFLDEGDKVKVTVRFRGREMAHRDIGVSICREVAERCKDLGTVETMPRMEGRQMFMILAPIKKKQPKPVRTRAEREDAADEEEDEEILDDASEEEEFEDDGEE
jgi:translation initiation factor IF-3